MNRLLFIVVVAVLGFAAVLPTAATNYPARNAWDQYRWPWSYGETWTISQGWNGTTTHTAARRLEYALDVYGSTTNAPV